MSVQFARSASAPQPSCSSAPQQEQGLGYCISASSFNTHDWKAPTGSAMLHLHRAGEERGILSIIYTIVTPWQNYQTSSSRGSLPYIRKTSVIMYFDLLLFFFPFLVHKELIKTHLTQSQSKTPQMRDEMGTEIHPGKSLRRNTPGFTSTHSEFITSASFGGPPLHGTWCPHRTPAHTIPHGMPGSAPTPTCNLSPPVLTQWVTLRAAPSPLWGCPSLPVPPTGALPLGYFCLRQDGRTRTGTWRNLLQGPPRQHTPAPPHPSIWSCQHSQRLHWVDLQEQPCQPGYWLDNSWGT